MLLRGHPAFASHKTYTPHTMKSLLTLALISSGLLLSSCANGHCVFAKKKENCSSCCTPAAKKSTAACCASHAPAKKK